MNRTDVFNLQGVEIFLINNFLDISECNHLCQMIKKNNQRSTVSGNSKDGKVFNEARTSKSAFLSNNDLIVSKINERISEVVQVPLSHGEPLQGQLYNTGEFYGDHMDYFDDYALEHHCLSSGQRTWTSMIYLNDVEEGGHTEFSSIGKSFAPQKGTALFWRNSHGRGSENPNTLHSGRPVVNGEKMIVTKWFRENVYNQREDERRNVQDQSKESHTQSEVSSDTEPVKIEYVNGVPHARYKTKEDIPALTSTGFKKDRIPQGLFQDILNFYNNGKMVATPEFDPSDNTDHLSDFIKSKETYYPTEMIPLTDQLKVEIFNGIEGILQEWVGRQIEPTYCYGIRSYKRGASLKKHTDGYETRIVSAILNVAQKVDEPWGLQIDDHQGNEHEVFLEPGEMALYESAILSHGRVKPLKGDYYSNLFVHFVNVN